MVELSDPQSKTNTMQADEDTRSVQDLTSITTVMDQAPPSPRRATISTVPVITRTNKNGGNVQCTHITVTRLYTTEFRCSQCLRPGSFGWIYRCTQDRELLLDEDMENGIAEKFDTLCDSLPRSITPRKRSPGARVDKLSLLTEISDEAMQYYTPEHLKILLAQRAHLLDVLSTSDDYPESFYTNRPLPTPYLNPPPGLPLPATIPRLSNGVLKPWFPLAGGECQFKCCHFCRPSLKDRSFLSLNGIVNGDIPATSIMGFGFQLQKERPVALVKHVKNLGMRPNPPPPLPPRTDDTQDQQNHTPSTPSKPPKKKIKRRPTSIGLGIYPSEPTHFSESPTSKSTTIPPPNASNPNRPSTPLSATRPSPMLSISIRRPTTPIQSGFEHQALSLRSVSGLANRRHSYSPSPRLSYSMSESSQRMHTLATVTPLPPPTPNEHSLGSVGGSTNIPLTPLRQAHSASETDTVAEQARTASVGDTTKELQEEAEAYTSIPSSTQTSLTAMETGQLIQREFGAAPLEVKDGVAVTEESVQLHVADVITQF